MYLHWNKTTKTFTFLPIISNTHFWSYSNSSAVVNYLIYVLLTVHAMGTRVLRHHLSCWGHWRGGGGHVTMDEDRYYLSSWNTLSNIQPMLSYHLVACCTPPLHDSLNKLKDISCWNEGNIHGTLKWIRATCIYFMFITCFTT
jgi:hypothetical protein